MYEDDYLDAWMESRLSGGDVWGPYDYADYGYDYYEEDDDFEW